jgi:hypothetical protein
MPSGYRLWAAGLAVALAMSVAAVAPAAAKNDKHRGRGNPEYRESRHEDGARYRSRDARYPSRGQVRYRTGVSYRSGYHYRRAPVRYVVVRRPRFVVVRPVYREYFVVHRPRFVVVRPVPCWPAEYGSGVSARIGVRTGGLNLDFGFRRHDPYYGCNFCDAYFTSYSAWEDHVAGCSHGPSERVLCEPWDDGDVSHFREGASRAWDEYEDDGDSEEWDD